MSVVVGEMKRIRIEQFNTHPPDDDTIWRRRTWGRATWVARIGLPWVGLRDFLRRRGFVMRRSGEVTHAPCAGCRRLCDVSALNYLRVCDTCGEGTPATLCRREREGRQERSDLRRSYTPLARSDAPHEVGPWSTRRGTHG